MGTEQAVKEQPRQAAGVNLPVENKISLIVFSGDLDKLLAALIISTGAVAMGMKARLFFTFWGTAALRDARKSVEGKNFMSKMFGFMLPKGAAKVTLSKMNMGGMGTAMMKMLMKQKKVASLSEMLTLAGQMGVEICVCEMSMSLMGFKREELIDYPHMSVCGVASFLAEATTSRVQLFI
jgi:peroxiredoxin family protein